MSRLWVPHPQQADRANAKVMTKMFFEVTSPSLKWRRAGGNDPQGHSRTLRRFSRPGCRPLQVTLHVFDQMRSIKSLSHFGCGRKFHPTTRPMAPPSRKPNILYTPSVVNLFIRLNDLENLVLRVLIGGYDVVVVADQDL